MTAENDADTSFDGTEVIANARREVHAKGRGLQVARLLTVFVALALIGTNVWLLGVGRAESMTRAVEANGNLARAVAERMDAMASEADHILSGLLFELERNDITAEALERLQPVLVSHVAALDHLQGLNVYDANGRWIASSEAAWHISHNDADLPFFAHHRDNLSAKLLIGRPFKSRSSGDWVVPLSRRINDANGRFDGVVLATFSVEQLVTSLNRFTIGTDGAITLLASGHIVARRPYREVDLGQRLSTPELEQLTVRQQAGAIDAVSPLDAVQRLVSFERGRDHALLVTVATSKDAVLTPWRRSAYVQTAWAMFLCLVLALAGTYAKRSMARRLQAQGHLLELSEALNHANEKYARLAKLDGLTGLPNRREFDQRFERASKLAQRARQPVAVVMVDVDQFKLYNDTYGHGQGDHCLKLIASVLKSVARRPEDLAARYGGEEFVLLLPFTDAVGAVCVAEEARAAVQSLKVQHAPSTHGIVSISLGVACAVPTEDLSATQLLRDADVSLYNAKEHGRNRVWPAKH